MESKDEVKKDNSIVYIIIIAILLTIIFSGIAWNAGRNYSKYEDSKYADKKEEKNNSKTEDIKKDDKEEDNKVDEKEENQNYKKDTTFTYMNEVDINEKDERVIELNGKKIKIVHENVDNPEEHINFIKLYVNDTAIYDEAALDGIIGVKFRKLIGKDNKEYLVISYLQWGEYVYILNDSAEIIFKYSDYNNSLDCFTRTNDGDYYYVDNEELYYYKYDEKGRNDDDSINMELIKLIINNNKVTESKVGTVKAGYGGQCG